MDIGIILIQLMQTQEPAGLNQMLDCGIILIQLMQMQELAEHQ